MMPLTRRGKKCICCRWRFISTFYFFEYILHTANIDNVLLVLCVKFCCSGGDSEKPWLVAMQRATNFDMMMPTCDKLHCTGSVEGKLFFLCREGWISFRRSTMLWHRTKEQATVPTSNTGYTQHRLVLPFSMVWLNYKQTERQTSSFIERLNRGRQCQASCMVEITPWWSRADYQILIVPHHSPSLIHHSPVTQLYTVCSLLLDRNSAFSREKNC